ncbi:MAG: 2,5-diamino-6-(ribosylamino)-4(3H)-pyrimidinone 5'-phosphate reductase [Halobacteria archaeon]|nr:2,5-diamino-6-(ribosylamino)-4(3H)-pyrimidinone 5'-phosphate reductase [Halobacteria archaeon]
MEVVVNAAMSVDGKISNRRRDQVELSSDEDFDRVDRLRAVSDCIMVGVGTVLSDDPSLASDNGPNPVRVVVDSEARTPTDADVLEPEGDVVVAVSDAPEERVERLRDAGATVLETRGDDRGRTSLAEVVDYLDEEGHDTLMVEGGGELIFSLVRDGIVDRLLVYVSPVVIGGRDSPTLVDGEGFVDDYPSLRFESVETMGEGVLLEWSFDGGSDVEEHQG